MATIINDLGGDTATFTEDGSPVLLDDSSDPQAPATVTDDEADLNGGSLTVSITANEVAAEDVLGISPSGTVTLSNGTNVGSIVSIGGLAIGTITSDGTGGNDLIVTFDTDDATPAAVSMLVQALNYSNTNTLDPSTAERTIEVTVADGAGGSDSESVFVGVAAVNDAPVATADSYGTDEDATLNVNAANGVLANDSDVDTAQESLTAILVSGPSHSSSFTLNSDGSFSYTPSSDYNGPDSFTYKVNDGTDDGNTVTVDLTIDAVNDPPVATADSYGTDEDATLNVNAANGVLANDTDVDTAQESLTAILVTGPSHSSSFTLNSDGSFSYTPSSDYNGPDSFTYKVNDGSVDGNTVTVDLTIDAVNDPPVATADSYGTGEDVALSVNASNGVLANDTDVDTAHESLTAILVTGPTHSSSFTLNSDGSFSYTPSLNYNGPDSFTYKVNDGSADGDTVTVSLTDDAVNDQPNVPNSPTISATEQVPILINSALAVSDADLDARNGGAGDYGGASFAINRSSSNAEDVFSFASSAGFTVNGSNLQSGGLTFATFTQSGGILNINFTSSGTPATTARVNDVLQHLQYTNISDSPPASVTLLYVLDDGAPGGGQGTIVDGNDVDGGQVIIDITDTTEAPVVDLNGAGAGTSATLAYTENQVSQPIAPTATVTDVDSPNFDGGVLTLAFTANGTDDDRLSIIDQGGGVGKITVDEGQVFYNFGHVDGDGNPVGPEVIGGFTGGFGGSDPLIVNLTSTATAAALQALIRTIGFFNVSDGPSTAPRTLTYTLSDEDSNTSNPVTATINIATTPDVAVANDDNIVTDDNVIVSGNVFADNGNGNDFNPDGGTPQVTQVNGSAAAVGLQITLTSGAKVILNSDGNFTYSPNGKFNSLVPESSGAANFAGLDSFTYTVAGGDTATVRVFLTGVVSPGDIYKDDSDNNIITGTETGNIFYLQQGGNDQVFGLGGDDGFLFGAALTASDQVDGGPGNDQLALQGNYAGLTLGANNLVNVETLVLLSGTDTRFGDPGTSLYSYNLTTVDANVVAGQSLTINYNNLRAGENVTFNGSAESDGNFLIFAGAGNDTLTGGAGNDGFLFGDGGRFSAADKVDGGAGNADQLALRGDYTATFAATTMVNVESLVLLSAKDIRFGALNTAFHYNITLNDANVGAGKQLIVTGTFLQSNETLQFNGSAETDGSFKILSGQADDALVGGAGNDIIYGNLGADRMTGGGGNDLFLYNSIADSTLGSSDGILDFTTGDKIDLSRIDAISDTPGDEGFTFIGGGAFTGHAGELRAFNGGGNNWQVQGDINGDGVADFQIIVTTSDGPEHQLTGADFIL